MRIRSLVALLAALALALTLTASATAVGGRPFVVEIIGANEAPGPGDPDGSRDRLGLDQSRRRQRLLADHVVRDRRAVRRPHPPGPGRLARAGRRAVLAGLRRVHDRRSRPPGRDHAQSGRLLREHPQRRLPGWRPARAAPLTLARPAPAQRAPARPEPASPSAGSIDR